MTGCLSVVATPIGCLEDITLRALRILREADAILAEDTRHTRTLCTKYEIRTPLRAFHEHTDEHKVARLVDELVGGKHFALVSDAGTPIVSDPGSDLVVRAAAAGVVVEAIPGPSAVLASLSVAGLPIHGFRFIGFLPRSGKERKEALAAIAEATETTVLFESPFRIHATLEDLGAVLDEERRLALCRELTKFHEQIIRGSVDEVRATLSKPARGEITLVIGAKGKSRVLTAGEVDVDGLVASWHEEGLSTKEMSRRLQATSGWPGSRAYRAVLDALAKSR